MLKLADGITSTGLLTVYWKYIQSQPTAWESGLHGAATRIKPLFKDEYMKYFVNEEVEAKAKEIIKEVLALAIAVRHKYFNQTLSNFIKLYVKHQIEPQVIILGAGFDTRPVRKKKYNAKFFEVDKQSVIQYKKEVYQKNNIEPNATAIALDYLKEDFIQAFVNAGIDLTAPTLFIWEGNTLYLSNSDIVSTIKRIFESFKGKIYLSFDYRNNKIEDKNISEIQTMEKKLEEINASMSNDSLNLCNITNTLNIKIEENISCAELTKKYKVGDNPYESQNNYYLCRLSKN